jgi:Skp family chaperone for outer membrane proteins
MAGKKCAAAVVCLLAGLLCVAAGDARAEEPLPIAILNMDRVFKTHQPLLDQLAPVREETKKLQETVALRQSEIETVATQLRKADQGSPEFQRLQMQAIKLQNELRQMVEKEQQALQKKESVIYLAFYRTLEEEVGKYSKAKGIKLVLRQQESSLDENQPLPDILKALSRSIIYQDGLDITDEILKALDARAAAETK